MRTFDAKAFARAFDEYVVSASWQEDDPGYYPRYRSRYAALLERLSDLAPAKPLDVLEVGGGQLALLSSVLWNDRAVVADVSGPQFPYLQSRGVATCKWDLCLDPEPFERRFDVVFLSEVIEHLPVPGHVVLEKLRRTMRSGGKLICSTPNLYRPRNIVYLALGRPLFDFFRYPTGEGLGHVLEYSADHLRYQIERAGFTECQVELRHFGHRPKGPGAKALAVVGAPLYLVPRFKDNLLATASVP